MSNKKLNIVYLQSEIHSYHLHNIRFLISRYNSRVTVIYWDNHKENAAKHKSFEGCTFYGKSQFNDSTALYKFLESQPIDIVRTAGWMDKDYVKVCKLLRINHSVATVACSDTQWEGSVRQWLGKLFYSRILRQSFSKIMVAGVYQFEYARKLGFAKNDIIFSNLSADSNLFQIDRPKPTFERELLYVGRLSPEKGISQLVKTWQAIQDKKGFILRVLGDGPLFESLPKSESIIYEKHLPSSEVALRMQNASFLVVPSIREQWGVVLHEAALSGLPVICSDIVGARATFLIENFNGFSYKTSSEAELSIAIINVLNLDRDKLYELKKNSIELGSRISTKISCASLVSTIDYSEVC